MGLAKCRLKRLPGAGGLRTSSAVTSGWGAGILSSAATTPTEILLVFRPHITSAPGNHQAAWPFCAAPTWNCVGDLWPRISQGFTAWFVTVARDASGAG